MRLSPLKAARRLGFTLLELMIVLVLMGIMSAMIIPELRGTFENALLRSSSREMISVFNTAYSRAVSVNQTHRVRLDLANARYYVEAEVPGVSGEFIPVQGVNGSEGKLDNRIQITILDQMEIPADNNEQAESFSFGNTAPDLERGDTITFYPDGTADRREVHLQDREGFRLALQINPVTARVRIVEMARK
ncbi:MAG: prepilin-type N-terminal cleavage/methylation domain-containing protein [Verrucomicrobia bacterium]|nr:prepilin-type N-terminal cleavage/methylation domain-containing protein [Verrucomicrobiota bacterium]